MDCVAHVKGLLAEQIDISAIRNGTEANRVCEIFGRLIEETDAILFTAYHDLKSLVFCLYIVEASFKQDSLFRELTEIVDEVVFRPPTDEETFPLQYISDDDPPKIVIEFRYYIDENEEAE